MPINKLTGVLVTVVAAASLSASAHAASLTLAHHNAVGSQIANRGETLKTCVDENEVNLTIQHLPAAQLGTAKEVIEQVMLGAVDMSITDTAYLSEIQPELAAFQLPFIFTDWDHAERAMEGTAGDLIKSTLSENQNMVVLAMMHNGFRDLLTKGTAVRSMEDMQTVSFRSPPLPLWLTMFEHLNVQPVTVPWNEVYTAMQTGLVDGLETTPEGMVSSKTYEVGQYVTQTGHMYNLTTLVISKSVFEGLDEAQRLALEECAGDFQVDGNAEVRQLAEESLTVMEDAGLEIIEVDKTPFQDALKPAWSEMASEGDVQAFIDAIIDAN